MAVFESTTKASSALKTNTVVAIGNYDGVHLGHQEILKKARAYADKNKLKLVVLSFEPHPVKFLAPEVAPKLIQTAEQKASKLMSSGVDVVVLQKFNQDFAKLTPEEFFNKHLKKNLKAQAIFVGYDFTFGKKRKGTTETLEALGKEHGIAVKITAAKMKGETLVSSSLVRKLIQQGEIKKASGLLAHDFFIEGTVIPGHKRGTALGIHTANLETQNELIPNDGVYATRIQIKKKVYQSVTNIGYNPTFENTERSIETHIFDFDQDIYDETIKLTFVDKLRDEIKFASPAALVKQIEKDIAQAKKVLS